MTLSGHVGFRPVKQKKIDFWQQRGHFKFFQHPNLVTCHSKFDIFNYKCFKVLRIVIQSLLKLSMFYFISTIDANDAIKGLSSNNNDI